MIFAINIKFTEAHIQSKLIEYLYTLVISLLISSMWKIANLFIKIGNNYMNNLGKGSLVRFICSSWRKD